MKVWLETMKEKTKRKNQQFRHLGHFLEDKSMLSLSDREKMSLFVLHKEREKKIRRLFLFGESMLNGAEGSPV